MDDPQASQPDAEPAAAEPAAAEPAADPSWPRCPWCSAPNPPGTERCSSCQAALVSVAGSNERSIVGLTEVDPGLREHEQWLRQLHEKKKEGIFRQLLSVPDEGEAPVYALKAEAAALQPPDEAVRREIARLEAEEAAARARAEANLRLAESLEEVGSSTAPGPEPQPRPAPEPDGPAGAAEDSADPTMPE